jgi:hypothetical protein
MQIISRINCDQINEDLLISVRTDNRNENFIYKLHCLYRLSQLCPLITVHSQDNLQKKTVVKVKRFWRASNGENNLLHFSFPKSDATPVFVFCTDTTNA